MMTNFADFINKFDDTHPNCLIKYFKINYNIKNE
jgi:hypothetical protein